MNHWAANYIGKKWESGKDGPDVFDCWGLVRDVQRNHFDRHVPSIIVDAYNMREVVDNFKNNAEVHNWREVEIPQDGDCVLMSQNKQPTHVGIWIKVEKVMGILHACRGIGVIFTPVKYLPSMGYNVLGYYTC